MILFDTKKMGREKEGREGGREGGREMISSSSSSSYRTPIIITITFRSHHHHHIVIWSQHDPTTDLVSPYQPHVILLHLTSSLILNHHNFISHLNWPHLTYHSDYIILDTVSIFTHVLTFWLESMIWLKNFELNI